jgi:hypothetical protein
MGIKRDPASFTVLKDNKQWDSVHRTLKAQTCYQDVDAVLDPSYKPKTAEKVELFAEKQCSTLERISQMDEGKVIIRSHDADRNAQSMHEEFLQVMTQSTEAMMDSGELLSHLATVKISDGTCWRGATKAFVLNWIDKLRLHHEVTPVADQLSENTQRTLLQNAVVGLNALQQVQINSDLQKATHGTVLTFTQCRTLLINTATGYDKRVDKPNSTGKPRRSVFNSETLFDDQGDFHDDLIYDDAPSEFDYDVDTTPSELLAFAMNRRANNERPQFKSGSRMPIARWKAVSEHAKKVWDAMEDDDKATVLDPQEKRKAQASPSDWSKFSVNTATSLTLDTPSDDALIAMVTKHSNRSKSSGHPADVRSVLSQPTKAATAQVKDNEISVNGHTHVRQVKLHDIQHSVSQACRKKKSSLVDRGANGGIAGSDARIIARHPHQTVDVCGIDNHEITSIPIVTAGAVARTQRGDVVVILHQCACHPQQGRFIHSSCQLESFANDVND